MVTIEKEMKITIKDSDGIAILPGVSVAFEMDGKCYIGIFKGINARGALMFKSVLSESEVTFNVMPKSIDRLEVRLEKSNV